MNADYDSACSDYCAKPAAVVIMSCVPIYFSHFDMFRPDLNVTGVGVPGAGAGQTPGE